MRRHATTSSTRVSKLSSIIRFASRDNERIWGGTRFQSTTDTPIGERWLFSDLPDQNTVVQYSGIAFSELIATHGERLMGSRGAGWTHFPLLFKLLDTGAPLSLQVHPGEETAKTHHDWNSKNEMWVVLKSDHQSELILGTKTPHTSTQEVVRIASPAQLQEVVNVERAQKDTAYMIPAGLVHGIGSGILIFEVQQSSDTTFRVYDYDRKDAQGNARQLHHKESAIAIDPKLRHSAVSLDDLDGIVIENEFFKTARQIVTEQKGQLLLATGESPTVLFALHDGIQVETTDAAVTLQQYELVLIPAYVDQAMVHGTQQSALIRITLPELKA